MSAGPIVLYDGECELCRRAVRRLRRWDRDGRIQFVAYQDREGVVRLTARFPRTPDLPALAAAMHVILPDGRVFAGADGVPELLRVLPRTRWWRWLFAVPGVRPLARRVYRAVAARRHCVVRPGPGSFA